MTSRYVVVAANVLDRTTGRTAPFDYRRNAVAAARLMNENPRTADDYSWNESEETA